MANAKSGGEEITTKLPTSAIEFDHINLNDIDDSIQAVEPNVYTLEINKFEPKLITPGTGDMAGQEVLVLKGSFTIVDDDTYSGRKLWSDFWTYRSSALKALKKLMNATGVIQQEGETLTDYAKQFGLLNPPARFQVAVTKVPPYKDPEGAPVNQINFFTSRPA